MNILSRIIILVCVFLIVFVGLDRLTQPVYWALFFVMALCVYLFWRSVYWISKKDLEGLGEPAWSLFCAKVNENEAEDLSRGRLVLDKGELKLYRKAEKKDKDIVKNARGKGFVLAWTMPVSRIDSVQFRKIVSIRRGFVLDCGDSQARFVCQLAASYKDQILKSCGF
ncbi:MAG: hypothetical protein WCR70_05970 [Sphaerochaetaceae bacterium]|jgi:hypothetical protein